MFSRRIMCYLCQRKVYSEPLIFYLAETALRVANTVICSFLYEVERLTWNQHDLKFHHKVSMQTRFTLEPNIFLWKGLFHLSCDLARWPVFFFTPSHHPLTPQIDHTCPSLSHSFLSIMKGSFHMRAQTL